MKPSRIVVASLLALLLMASGAAAQKPEPGPEADLSVKLQPLIGFPRVGDSFQLVYTVRNHGPENATDAVFSQYLPPEIEFVGAASSDPSDECAPGYPPSPEGGGGGTEPPQGGGSSSGGGSTTAADAPGYYGDSMYCSLGTLNNGQSATITLNLKRIGAREIYTSAYVYSSLGDSVYDNNYVDLQLDADKSHPADVGVTMESPKSPDVGADFTYKIFVSNQGPSTADSITMVNPLGYGLSYVSASPPAGTTCELNDYSEPGTASPDYGGYSELVCVLQNVASGQTVEIGVKVNRASAYEIWNNASVVTSNYDEFYENDYAYYTIPADPSVTSDLAVTMTGPKTAPLVGDQFDLTITVTNGGPAASGDTWLSDYLPPDLEFVSASPADTCSFNDAGPYPMADAPQSAPSQEKGDAYYPISPGGLYCSLGSIASGGSSTVTVTVKRVNAREIWNSAWVSSSNYDPNYENNYSDLLIAPDKSKPADVAVTMTAPANPDVGSDFAFEIQATNNGPSTADRVVVTDYVPYGTDFKSVSSSDASDTCVYNDQGYYDEPQGESLRPSFIGFREVVCELGSMASGETATITIEVTRSTEYEIWNSAWVTTSNYDESYDNDYASVLVKGEPYPGSCPLEGDVEGTKKSDSIVIGECYAETKAGADSVEVVPPSAGNSRVNSGRGPDTINVNLSIGSSTRRMINVATGRGGDYVRITVAPGAGNATILVKGGSGNDTFELDVPSGRTGLRIVILGGDGKDTVTWLGDRATPGGLYPGLKVRGGNGSDLVQGGFGNDHLRGGRGGDRLYGNLGNDVLRGGSGYDVCRAGPGDNMTLGC